MCRALTEHLTENVEALGERETLVITELRADGVVVWKVQRDENGTPGARQSVRPEPWTALYNDGVLSGQELRRITRPRSGMSIVYVAASPNDSHAAQTLDWVRSAEPEAQVFHCPTPVDEVLRDVISGLPLTRWYDLVVLRRSPSGRLALARHRLFPPGATRGDQEPFTVRCARSNLHGTAFAIISYKSKERGFQLVSVQAAKIPPGRYDLVAELRRPGAVAIRDLPAPLHDDPRSWSDLIASVPERLERVRSSHLVCLIEMTGTTDQVSARLDRTRQLFEFLSAECENRVAVSVISYGSHAVDVGESDNKPRVVVSAASVDTAISAIDRLTRSGTAGIGYTRAAQLECALAEAARRLDDDGHGRPVVLAVGQRSPFPPRVDTSEIIPCPQRHDWRTALRRLRELPGVSFGAIHDASPDDQVWNQLGSNANADLGTGAFNRESFAVNLGLTGTTVDFVPFPLIEAEED